MLSEKGVAVCRWEDPSDWRENMGPKVNDSAAVTFRDLTLCSWNKSNKPALPSALGYCERQKV